MMTAREGHSPQLWGKADVWMVTAVTAGWAPTWGCFPKLQSRSFLRQTDLPHPARIRVLQRSRRGKGTVMIRPWLRLLCPALDAAGFSTLGQCNARKNTWGRACPNTAPGRSSIPCWTPEGCSSKMHPPTTLKPHQHSPRLMTGGGKKKSRQGWTKVYQLGFGHQKPGFASHTCTCNNWPACFLLAFQGKRIKKPSPLLSSWNSQLFFCGKNG